MIYVINKNNHIYITSDERVKDKEEVIFATNNEALATRVLKELLKNNA